ncbi:MAG: metallophosphoesterase family protein [Chitinophagaceae bacterium]
MTNIGLISDTHSYLDEQVFAYFKDCDEIWHAGDLGTMEIANRLGSFKPLRAVYGNIDNADVQQAYPEKLRWQCEGMEIFITHIGGYPGKYTPWVKKELMEHPTQLFISGHSHILKVLFDKKINCLHMNPGAAGKHGWHTIRTLIRFSIDGTAIKNCEVIELGKR